VNKIRTMIAALATAALLAIPATGVLAAPADLYPRPPGCASR
jgi:hypothetical protein